VNANFPPSVEGLRRQTDEELVEGLIYSAAEGREYQQDPECVERRRREVLRRLKERITR
jgi:hypothetical protein